MTDVRAATPDDAGAIADINVRSWRHAYRGIMPDSYLATLDAAAIARRVRDVALSGSATILVAASPEVRGFSWMSRSRDDDAPPETAEITAIYVDPQYERRGIGRALACASCDVARSQGFTRISLWVLDDNARARAFYEALKFAPDGRTRTTSRWGGIRIREVRYTRPTTPSPRGLRPSSHWNV
jgi:ribosomal protein S18 acetylase RimI-like enzyme